MATAKNTIFTLSNGKKRSINLPEWVIKRAIEGARAIKVPFDQFIHRAICDYVAEHCEEDFIILSDGSKYDFVQDRIIEGKGTPTASPFPPMKTCRASKAPKESSPFSQSEVDKGISYLDGEFSA